MNDVSEFSVGLAHEFVISAAKAGFTAQEFREIVRNHSLLKQFHRVYTEKASVVEIEHLIDCNHKAASLPFTDNYHVRSFSVKYFPRGGLWKWAPEELTLWQMPEQSRETVGRDLWNVIEQKEIPVLNANVLDYLIAHPHLIPKDWVHKCVYFWGTIYYESGLGGFYVRRLTGHVDGSGYHWGSRDIPLNHIHDFDQTSFAVVFKDEVKH
jgi:hypothetical protein